MPCQVLLLVVRTYRRPDWAVAATSSTRYSAILVARRDADACAAIRNLRTTGETTHVPVIAFCDPSDRELQKTARAAGATLIAARDGILDQLPALLDQAIAVD